MVCVPISGKLLLRGVATRGSHHWRKNELETRFHLLCGIWKYLIAQENKKYVLILSFTLACSLALFPLLQACNVELDPI